MPGSIIKFLLIGLFLGGIIFLRLCSWNLKVDIRKDGQPVEVTDRRSGTVLNFKTQDAPSNVVLVSAHPVGRPDQPLIPQEGGIHFSEGREAPLSVGSSRYIILCLGQAGIEKKVAFELRYDAPWSLSWRRANILILGVFVVGAVVIARLWIALSRYEALAEIFRR